MSIIGFKTAKTVQREEQKGVKAFIYGASVALAAVGEGLKLSFENCQKLSR